MSKTERTDGVYLLHIVESFQDVREFVADKSYGDFAESKLLVNAVIRSFEVAGEATKNLSSQFRQSHPEIDWAGMSGFRDVLIHQYFGIDLPNVWEVIEHFIPETLPKLMALDSYKSMQAVLG